MRLTDEGRSVLDKFANSMFATVSLPADVLKAIRAILARDADGDVPADAAWMDGEEAKGLRFASTQAGCWGLCRPGGTINVYCHAKVSSIELVDDDLDGFSLHDPTRRQIRAAVELVGRGAT